MYDKLQSYLQYFDILPVLFSWIFLLHNHTNDAKIKALYTFILRNWNYGLDQYFGVWIREELSIV